MGTARKHKVRDAMERIRSKRHSDATKQGIKQAKKVKRGKLKASSLARGKSKGALAQALLTGAAKERAYAARDASTTAAATAPAAPR